MSVKELLNRTHTLLNDFFDKIDSEQIENIVKKIVQSQGILIFTGVGKSGLIAQKLALTFTSTGRRALFISPTDSMHGDMGIVSDGDLVFLLSKSGESDELITLLPYLRNKGAFLIGVVMNSSSRLAKGCDQVIVLPFQNELCPFDMAPTLSTTEQLILGDVLAIAVMEEKQISQDQFASNHPAGRIGKRVTMKVKDLMIKELNLPLCQKNQKLIDVLPDFTDKRAGCILIVDAGNVLLGIFTDGDLRRALQKHGQNVLDLNMEDLMIKDPRRIESSMLAIDALHFMERDQKSPIMVLPVVDGDQVVGLIKLHDIIQSGV